MVLDDFTEAAVRETAVLDLAVSTVLLAGLYATMAYGLGLIYGVLRLVNLAHAGVIMAGAYLGWLLHLELGLDPYLSIPLVVAYVVRFFSIGLQTVDASLEKVRPSMEDAARSLGCGPVESLLRIHVPIMARGLSTAALLIFVEVMKELPATLVMRPFNFDTLATQVYILALDERLAEASTASLAIVVVGLIVQLQARVARRLAGAELAPHAPAAEPSAR